MQIVCVPSATSLASKVANWGSLEVLGPIVLVASDRSVHSDALCSVRSFLLLVRRPEPTFGSRPWV